MILVNKVQIKTIHKLISPIPFYYSPTQNHYTHELILFIMSNQTTKDHIKLLAEVDVVLKQSKYFSGQGQWKKSKQLLLDLLEKYPLATYPKEVFSVQVLLIEILTYLPPMDEAEQALKLASETFEKHQLSDPFKWKLLLAKALMAREFDRTQEAISYSKEILASLALIKDKELICKAYFRLGVSLQAVGEAEEGIKMLLQSLSVAEKNQILHLLPKIYYALSYLLFYEKIYDKTHYYLNKTIEAAKAINAQLSLSYAYHLQGSLHTLYQVDYEAAYECYLKSAKIKEAINYYKGLTLSYISLSNVCQELNQNKKAIYWLEKGIEVSKKDASLIISYEYISNLASLHFFNNNTEKAIAYLTQLSEQEVYQKSYDKLADINNTLVECYKKLGDYKLAYYHQTKVIEYEKLDIERGQQKRVQALQLEYEATKKAKEALEIEVQKRTEQIEKDKKTIEKQAHYLEELIAFKSSFFTNISHELRNPVSLIISPVQEILQGRYGQLNPLLEKKLQMIERNSTELLSLIEEILMLAKLESDKLTLHHHPTSLLTFCKRLYASLEGLAQQKQIQFDFHYQGNPQLTVQLDQTQTAKILNNLLINAIKYTPKHGQVNFNIHTTKEALQFIIKDNGKGIHPDDLPHIFDRFYQSQHSDHIKSFGIGIGLALVKEVSKILGGQIQVESQLGEGSIFTFTLPLVKSQTTTQIIQIETQDTLSATSKITIPEHHQQYTVLIVEDNPDMQQFIQEIIAPHYSTYTANNGNEALAILKDTSKNINLVISDILMPELDGLSLLQIIKSTEQWASTPVIMLTALATEDDRINALTIGVDDYLIKPFSPNELVVRSLNLIENYHKKQKWLSKNKEIPTTYTSANQEWIKKIEGLIKDNIDSKQLNIGFLADELYISDRQLYRKVKSITGLTPNKYILEIKLQVAKKLLEQKVYYTISEVAYAIGFETSSYFSKVYEKRFGKRPGDYFKNDRSHRSN